ncbi:hypothetical protein AWM75_02570 [Aerococcus urinaehominis]|uniref:Probable membrane transporter protein n=2 Tax=Aerococcus urinaehominis TaxID=128944 RepID=A0A109RGN1_9LACT|nr:sulfite exporter TauE/SafE family protein [Aerococcus urinaehominis]AMB98946.1 hypothetical protein AWM75_02570 [Aerococcus urinaehominis]SDM40784.1 hypothetical protein SAMN04487985_11541 [Aerococcus urinaehominis]
MLKGLLYFVVIILANSVGAISGMGGGVIIKPVLDLIGLDPVEQVSFYSTVAVFAMSLVSTYRQSKQGVDINWGNAGWLSAGSVAGGILGNSVFEMILNRYNGDTVQLTQIVLTVITLIFAYVYNRFDLPSFQLAGKEWFAGAGLFLGFLASLLGIGGGPINVSLLMLLFAMPIKPATVYSICTIFFSQLSKIITIALTTGFDRYDMGLMPYIIVAGVCGGFLGAKLSRVMADDKINLVFRAIIILVCAINVYNGFMLFS